MDSGYDRIVLLVNTANYSTSLIRELALGLCRSLRPERSRIWVFKG